MIRAAIAFYLRLMVDHDDEELRRQSMLRDHPEPGSDAWGVAVIMRNNARRDRARQLAARVPSTTSTTAT